MQSIAPSNLPRSHQSTNVEPRGNSEEIKVGQVLHGFECLRSEDAPLTGGRAYHLRHQRLGTELVISLCKDQDRTFCLEFKTPATSDDGTPHVLEHLVLAGSKNFPLKAPFFSALRGSFQTYQNAVTTPSFTRFPFGTTNPQEYQNLLTLYLDATFFPRLLESAFRQEGVRLDFVPGPDGELVPIFDGVVLNEMKGAHSEPGAILANLLYKTAYPDTHLAHCSDGDPSVIPTLTLEKIRAYHQRFYHPSNARIVLHGDLDVTTTLAEINSKFSSFAPLPGEINFPSQLPFQSPRSVIASYASKEEDAPAMQGLGWVLPPPGSPTEKMAWEILTCALFGESASPLRKIIMESELVSGLQLEGLFNDISQPMFHVGLMGVEKADLNRTAEVVYAAIRRLVKDGIPREEIEATLNAREFLLRERYSDQPQGLDISESILDGYTPLSALDTFHTRKQLDEVKRLAASSPRFFEEMLETHIVQNPHHVRIDLIPDSTLEETLNSNLMKAAKDRATEIGPTGVELEIAKNAEMRRWIASADTPELIEKLPTVPIHKIPQRLPITPEIALSVGNGTCLLHDVPTNGIVYSSIAFDILNLPERLIPYAPFVAHLIGDLPTATSTAEHLSYRIANLTGGIENDVVSMVKADGNGEMLAFIIAGRALEERAGDLQLLIQEQLLTTLFNDKGKITQIAKEMLEDTKSSLIDDGENIAFISALSAIHPGYTHRDMVSGLSQARFQKALVRRLKNDFEGVRADLCEFSKRLFNNNAVVALAGAPHTNRRRELLARGTIESLPPAGQNMVEPTATQLPLPAVAAFSVDSPVNYIAKVGRLTKNWREYCGELFVAQRAFTFDVALPKIRVAGNAYSANSIFHVSTGIFALCSFRDPKIHETLAVFDDAPRHIGELGKNLSQFKSTVVGAANAFSPFELPREQADEALICHLSGSSPELQQSQYESILSATPKRLRDLADLFAHIKEGAVTRILGNRESLKRAGYQHKPAI